MDADEASAVCLNLKHRERGQSTVELAFATLILAVLVVGMVGVTEVCKRRSA